MAAPRGVLPEETDGARGTDAVFAGRRAPTGLLGRLVRLEKVLIAISLVLLLAGVGMFVAESSADAAHVESGIALDGVDVSGLDADGLRAALDALESKLSHRPLRLAHAGREVVFDPSTAAFAIDREATVQAVLAAGRDRSFLARLRSLVGRRTNVPIVVSLDAEALRAQMTAWEAALVADAPSLGAVRFEGATPVAVPPKAGSRVTRDALEAAIRARLEASSDAPIDVPVESFTPTLGASDVKAAVDRAAELTRGPITLVREPTAQEIADADAAEARRQKQIDEQKALAPKLKKRKKKGEPAAPPPKPPPPVPRPETISLTFTPSDLAAAIRTRTTDDGKAIEVSIDPADVARKLESIADKLADSARDARFEIDAEDHVTIVPSRTGTRVDPEKVIPALLAAAKTADRKGELPVDRGVEPALTTEAAEALHIDGLVTKFTTRHPCCQPRVVNIHRIADMMDGVLVKPGETFSVNKWVGPRTTERGFVLAPSIGDGEMVDTVGGGISQFATTLFNCLFDAGYAIKERKAHSYWFPRYPMGIEATLSDPYPDLAFYNDSEAGILIKAKYDKTSITVRLYGNNGGRKVERHVSAPFDLTQPKIEYEANDAMEPDEEKVIDKGTNGWSVWASRTITFPGGERREEKRKVTYNPRTRVVRVHSCNIPKDEDGYTGKPCPKPKDDDGDSGSSGTGFDPQTSDPTL
ncbi:MAG: VanW family protein [Polyangiaceae bacterium]